MTPSAKSKPKPDRVRGLNPRGLVIALLARQAIEGGNAPPLPATICVACREPSFGPLCPGCSPKSVLD